MSMFETKGNVTPMAESCPEGTVAETPICLKVAQ